VTHFVVVVVVLLQCVLLQIQIGRMSDVNGRLQKMRGSTVLLTVEQSVTVADILSAAVVKLAALN